MSGIDGKVPPSSSFGPPEAAHDRDGQDESSTRARGSRFGRALLGLVLLLGALAYRDLLFWDPGRPGLPGAGRLFFRVSETAPQIFFLLAVPLLYRKRKRLARALRGEAAPWSALPILALGVALFVWGHHANAPDLVLVSLMAVILGSALLLSGRNLARELMLPLVFLAFAIPLPGVLTNQLIYPLQLSTAVHTGWLLQALGITFIQEGNMLHLASSSSQIIESCSGLRSMIVLTALAVGWLCFFPARRLPAALLIASAPVIAYLVNTLRVLSLVLYPSSELAKTHSLQGAGIFLVGALILGGVDGLLRRIPGGSAARIDAPENDPPRRAIGDRRRSVLALATALAVLLGVSIWGPRSDPPDQPRRLRINLPQEIGGWRVARRLKPDRISLGSLALRAIWYGEYERGDETVTVFVGYDARLNRNYSLISPKNAVPGPGWHVEERTTIRLAPSDLSAESVLARSLSTRTLNLHWYQGTDPLALEILRAGLATDQSSLRRPGGAWLVRIGTNASQIREAKERAEARLRGFAELLAPRVESSLTGKTTPRRSRPGRSGS